MQLTERPHAVSLHPAVQQLRRRGKGKLSLCLSSYTVSPCLKRQRALISQNTGKFLVHYSSDKGLCYMFTALCKSVVSGKQVLSRIKPMQCYYILINFCSASNLLDMGRMLIKSNSSEEPSVENDTIANSRWSCWVVRSRNLIRTAPLLSQSLSSIFNQGSLCWTQRAQTHKSR